MTDELGRNDPCWCGSGKKYKKCHYLTEAKDVPFWDTLRSTWLDLQIRMVRFHKKTWEAQDNENALRVFYAEDDDAATDIEQQEVDLLVSQWFFAPWTPGIAAEDSLNDHPSLVRRFLDANTGKLRELETKILESLDKQPFSFYQFRSVKHGESITLRDLFLGEELVVMDSLASMGNPVGQIVFGRILTVDTISILTGVSPDAFEPTSIAAVQKLREWLSTKGPLNYETLKFREADVRRVYFMLRNQKRHPVPPKMCNTDGDPLEFQRLEWRLEIPLEEAIASLLSLALETKEEVMSTARRDGPGTLTWVEIHWAKKGNKANKGMENTLLSHMELVPGKITAEVNSQKRATKLKKEIGKRLGDGAFFEKAVIESFEGKMRAAQIKGPSVEKPLKDPEEEAAMEEALVEMQKRHWEAWIDEPLPALGGLTPKKAVKIKDGREMVEALLFSFEEANQRATRPSLVVPVDQLRKRLKL